MIGLLGDDVRQCSTGKWIGRDRSLEAEPAIAKAIGITIPPSLLLRADEVIQ